MALATDAEYRAALARIDELAASDDLELVGEMEALANYVEAWETKKARISAGLSGGAEGDRTLGL